jgi:hypothetical protein
MNEDEKVGGMSILTDKEYLRSEFLSNGVRFTILSMWIIEIRHRKYYIFLSVRVN